MSKKNLQTLLNKIIAESSKKTGYRDVSDTFAHNYEVDLDDLIREIEDQIAGTFVASKASVKYTLSTEQKNIIESAAITYFNEIKTSLKATRFFSIEFKTVSPKYFQVEIIGAKKGYNVFGFINKIRSAPLEKLRKTLMLKLSESIVETGTLHERILGNYNPTTGERSGGLLQLGHLKGVSVAEQRASRYLKSIDIKVSNLSKVGDSIEEHPLARLQATISSNPMASDILKQGKITVVGVKEQGQKSNQAQSVIERKLISFIRKEIEQSLKKEDWTHFKSSPSAVDILVGKIHLSAKKAGAKKYDKKALDNLKNSYAKAEGTFKGKKTKSTSKDSNSVKVQKSIPARDKTEKGKFNWASLINILNHKLPGVVMNNMISPALVNRTGKFANSVSVVNIETTKQQFPSIVYTYERDPYDVFDRSVGRSPWNTPNRDPKILIDKSIREIVRDMAIGRFYTRRL